MHVMNTSTFGDLLLSDQTMKTTTNSRQISSHILYTYTHTRLQNEITYIIETNKFTKQTRANLMARHITSSADTDIIDGYV